MTASNSISEERFSIPGATVEYRVAGTPPAPGATPATGPRMALFRIGDNGLEFACQERLTQGQRVILTVNVPGRHGYLKLIGEVKAVKPAPPGLGHKADVAFTAYSAGMAHRIQKLRKTYASPERWGAEPAQTAGATEGVPREKTAREPVEELESVEEERDVRHQGSASPRLPRVSERDLVAKLRSLSVDERFITDVLEACEAGINLDELYRTEMARTPQGPAGPEATVKPIPVYPLNKHQGLQFDENWVPRSTPLSYVSVPFADDNCFACQLEGDDMDGPEPPNFKPGDIVVFSATEPVASGDFALVLTADGCVFREVTFPPRNNDGDSRQKAEGRRRPTGANTEPKDEMLELRALNDRHEPRALRRADVKGLWKMIGRCEQY